MPWVPSPPPESPRDLHAWLAEQTDELARLATAALRRFVTEAYRNFTRSLTAATGDLTTLDAISTEWSAWVRSTFAERLAGIHLSGALSAWLSAAGRPIPAAFAEGWAAVVNEAAVSYQATAANRLVNVGETTWKMIRAQTVHALETGMTTEALKGRIEQVASFSEYRADTIARTETVAAYNAGDREAAAALGEYGPVEKVWLATLDERAREAHADLNDTCIPVDEPFNVNGYSADGPHDPSLPAGEVVNCRCVIEYLYPGDLRPDGSHVPGADDDELQTDDGLLTDDDRAAISADFDEVAEQVRRG